MASTSALLTDAAIGSAHAATSGAGQAPVPRRTAADYPLQRDAAEHARLDAQAAFWAADAAALFDAAGLPRGARVADLGCGTLHVAQMLAARVGPGGRVRALDSDAALVERLTAQAGRVTDAPVELLRGDAYATGWPDASLDAVHARFLAAPAGRLQSLLGEMRRVVRPGGLLMLQEPEAQSWDVPGAGAAWQELRALIRAGFAARGGDFDAGRALAPALERAGVTSPRARRVVHVLPASHPYAALPLAFARQLQSTWTYARLATDAEVASLCDAVAQALRRAGSVTTFTLVQAWGRVDDREHADAAAPAR